MRKERPMARTPRLVSLLRSVLEDGIRGTQPDLAWLARELGAVVHLGSDGRFDQQLNGLRGRAKRGFTRLLIADSKRPAFSASLLIWPPGHITPVNSMSGDYGMELVVQGSLEVQEYAIGAEGEPPSQRNIHWLGESDALWFERTERLAHRCRNLSSQNWAITLHLHGGALPSYRLFERAEGEKRWSVRPRIARVHGRVTV
jgi:predicted metal-dependent enzyme (double-stranded beta helix superfamily)